ncbi:MAG: glycoside hydrolase family 3 protein, partial [Gammaproteobacteria bacterium]
MKKRPARVAGYCAGALALCALQPAPGADLGTAGAARVHPQRWPKLRPVPPRDESLERRLDLLLARMRPEQKVGQLIQADIDSITPDDLRHYPLGSILNGGNSSPHGDKLAPPREWLTLADRFYDASLGAPGSAGIPALWGADAVHRHNNIPGATIFPHNIGLGAARDPQLIRRIGQINALEVRVTGLDWAFSPTTAVARDPRWGRTYESHSQNPALVRRLRAAQVPVVAVLLSGRPLWVNGELDAADSFVAAWLAGPEGEGVADVLFRAADGSVRHDFRGKLPFS